MRTKHMALLAGLLLFSLLLPPGVSAKTVTMLGSLTITKVVTAGPPIVETALTTELVGIALIANPGLEKIITQQLPPFTVPVFVDVDADDVRESSGPKILRKRVDTTLILTNTTDDPLEIHLTLRDPGGNTLGTQSRTLGDHATLALSLSDLLP